MNLPFFYIAEYDASQQKLVLDEDTSRHVVQVLRMKPGAQLNLTDGNGSLLTCDIVEDHKKHCLVNVVSTEYRQPPSKKISIAISLLKNANRFEWFLEKATEIGVNEIIPLLCTRTEKEKSRHERLLQICISAMLQSQQVWLPVLHHPIAFDLLFRQEEMAGYARRLIAHCETGSSKSSLSGLQYGSLETAPQTPDGSSLILIGPEGDFTHTEIALALSNNFIPVSLGDTRLRSETAGIVASVLLRQV